MNINKSLTGFFLISVLLLISLSGCVETQEELEENLTPDITDDDLIFDSEELCELEKEYEHTAVNPISCVCPEGYSFETLSTFWGPCPVESMRDCPASILICSEN